MTPRDFIANFDTIAEAPNGIARLREFVLQLAVRGKLVPQAPDDEPARFLLRQLKEGKERLLADEIIAKPRHPCGMCVTQEPFDVPATWTWLRLGDVGAIVGGGTPISGERSFWANGDGVPWLTPADMRSQGSRYISRGNRDITSEGLKRSSAQLLPAGSVLFSSRAPIGHVGIAANPLSTNQGFKSCVPYIEDMSEYLYLFLKQAGPGIDEQATGTTFKEISGKQVALIPIPIPPLGEQHRIVAKVDELMGLLDRLEEARRRRETMRTASRDSAFAALRAAGTADEIKATWMRIAVRMDELFITPADVTPLREAVIQLAIRGRLVAQDPEKIDNCCEQHFTEIQERTQSFELPSGWIWSNLKLLGRVCGGGTPSKRNPEFWSGDIPWISPKDMKRDLINQSQDMVTAKAIDSSSIKLVPSGALLMVVRGMILDHSFPVAVTEAEVTINQDMKALIPFDSRLSRYLLLLMKGMKVEILKLVKTSTHGTCRLPTDDLFSIPLPIPPVEVQQSIISKVDDVMNVLDQLSFRLTAQRNAHNTFATSFLHHLNT